MFPHTTWQSVHSLSKISWGKITSECLPCIHLAQESQWDSLSVKLNFWILCSSSGTSVGPSQPGSLTRSWGPFLPVYGFVLGHIFRESTWCVPVSQSFSISLSAFKPLSAHLRALWHCLGHHLATQVTQWLRTNNHYAKQTPTGLNSLLQQQHFRTGLPPTRQAFGSFWSEPRGASQVCFPHKWLCLLSFPHILTSPQHRTLL